MSSIPNAKMKHAHVQDESQPTAPKQEKASKADKSATLGDRAREIGERAQDIAEDAVDAVKARPKTAAAVGAAIVAGAAALVGAPALAKKLKGEEPKKPAKKTAKKKA